MSAIAPSLIVSLRRLAEDLALPDAYALVAAGATPDGEGGRTGAATTIEAGQCLVKPGTTNPDEREIAARQGYQAPYTILLPLATLASAEYRLVAGGREFEIGGVLRGGAWGVLARAVCAERG